MRALLRSGSAAPRGARHRTVRLTFGLAVVVLAVATTAAAGRPGLAPAEPAELAQVALADHTAIDLAAPRIGELRSAPRSDDLRATRHATPRVSPGDLLVVPGRGATFGDGRLYEYVVEVEAGTGFDPEAVTAEVDHILGDPRSWIGLGRHALRRTDAASSADIRIVVARPATVDRWCARAGLRTGGWLSCQVGRRAMLNATRWSEGIPSYGGDLAAYRAYLVNHEVGHVLGFGHVGCPASGALAPVMMQQTKSLGVCRPNGWVRP